MISLLALASGLLVCTIQFPLFSLPNVVLVHFGGTCLNRFTVGVLYKPRCLFYFYFLKQMTLDLSLTYFLYHRNLSSYFHPLLQFLSKKTSFLSRLEMRKSESAGVATRGKATGFWHYQSFLKHHRNFWSHHNAARKIVPCFFYL